MQSENQKQKIVGYRGGSSFFQLCYKEDMEAFFKIINDYVITNYPEENFSLITKDLYRKYIKLKDLEKSLDLMKKIQLEFKKINTKKINWNKIGINCSSTKLDLNKNNLLEVFDSFFKSFEHCAESARLSYEAFKFYEPVTITLSDIISSVIFKEISLEEYDKLTDQDLPFWQNEKAVMELETVKKFLKK